MLTSRRFLLLTISLYMYLQDNLESCGNIWLKFSELINLVLGQVD